MTEQTSIPIPPELPREHVDTYIVAVREMVAHGADPEKIAVGYSAHVLEMRAAGFDPLDPALHDPVEMTREEMLRWLETGEIDPVLLAFARAPVVHDEQLTDEQRAEEAAAMAAGTAGSVSHDEVVAMIRKRAEEAGELEAYEELMSGRGTARPKST